MIEDQINPSQRIYCVRGGDARIFGQDSDVRRRMTDQEAEERFAKVWTEKLEPHVRIAPIITAEQARELLEERQRSFAPDAYQYRQFMIDSVPFVVRLNKDATEIGICNQVWPLGAHRDPSRLCMHFETVAEKEAFDGLARSLNYDPRHLALELVMDFMRKHPRRETMRRMP